MADWPIGHTVHIAIKVWCVTILQNNLEHEIYLLTYECSLQSIQISATAGSLTNIYFLFILFILCLVFRCELWFVLGELTSYNFFSF